MLRILLADDHAMVVGPLAEKLAQESDFVIIGTATRPQQIWEQLQQPVDLLLLDLYLGPDIRDLSLARQLQQQYPALKIVILTGETSNIRLIAEARKMKLAGYLSKAISTDELIQELQRAAQGIRVYSPDVLSILLSDEIDQLPELTSREAEIISLLMLGMKREAIFNALDLGAKSTYDSHVGNLKGKFGVTSTNELIRKAAELGYV